MYLGQRNLQWTYLKNTPASLLWRTLPSHVAYGAAAGIGYALSGHGWTFLKAKAAAAAGLRDPAQAARRPERTPGPGGRDRRADGSRLGAAQIPREAPRPRTPRRDTGSFFTQSATPRSSTPSLPRRRHPATREPRTPSHQRRVPCASLHLKPFPPPACGATSELMAALPLVAPRDPADPHRRRRVASDQSRAAVHRPAARGAVGAARRASMRRPIPRRRGACTRSC